MKRYRETISYLSNRPYIGHVGSGSVSGYWTVWTVRINGYNQMVKIAKQILTKPKPEIHQDTGGVE